jgi:hypothetical protein
LSFHREAASPDSFFRSKSFISRSRFAAWGCPEIGKSLAVVKVAGREKQKILGASEMTIEKKSLISALKTTMKANAVKEDISGNATTSTSEKMPGFKSPGIKGAGAKGPGAKGPGAKGPGAKGPGAKGPGAKGPGAKGPGGKGLAAKW